MTRERAAYLHRGEVVPLDYAGATTTLLDHLRLHRRATGTKEGCNEGDCGACTVVLSRVRDGRLVHEAVNSCILLAGQADGAELITVEDLADGAALHPVQAAMVEHHGSQCGFCTPGIVMSLFSLYQDAARPVSRQAITDQLAGNLCRCTGYRPIIDAAAAACASSPQDRFTERLDQRRAALDGMAGEGDLFLADGERFFAVPASVASLARLAAAHPDATLLAGATDVGLWITKKLQDLPKIIWLGRVAGLGAVTESDDALVIGASARLADVEVPLAAIDPDLGELVRRFASRQIRASATVGGNIANGSPIGDLAPCLIALGSTLALQSEGGERRLPLERFFLAYGRQDRRPGEFVRSLEVPRLRADQLFRCFKVSKRPEEDISAVMAAFRFTLAGRRIGEARIAYGGMAATPKRATLAEAALAGVSLDDRGGWQAAITALAADFQPMSDMRASAEYRMSVAQALLEKALLEVAAEGTGAMPALRLSGLRGRSS